MTGHLETTKYITGYKYITDPDRISRQGPVGVGRDSLVQMENDWSHPVPFCSTSTILNYFPWGWSFWSDQKRGWCDPRPADLVGEDGSSERDWWKRPQSRTQGTGPRSRVPLELGGSQNLYVALIPSDSAGRTSASTAPGYPTPKTLASGGVHWLHGAQSHWRPSPDLDGGPHGWIPPTALCHLPAGPWFNLSRHPWTRPSCRLAVDVGLYLPVWPHQIRQAETGHLELRGTHRQVSAQCSLATCS